VRKEMTITQAVIIIDRLNTTERINVDRVELAEAVRVVSAAAKYRIPRKPDESLIYWDRYHDICPSCRFAITNVAQQFCNNCGQALDWGKN